MSVAFAIENLTILCDARSDPRGWSPAVTVIEHAFGITAVAPFELTETAPTMDEALTRAVAWARSTFGHANQLGLFPAIEPDPHQPC